MKNLFLFLIVFSVACSSVSQKKTINKEKIIVEVDSVLTQWHKAAASANFDEYFSNMADSSIFMGTDASEYWTKSEFMAYSKPHFDKGRAWDFYASKRNIFVNDSGAFAWFSEELVTQNMGECRGSGVLSFKNGSWLIEQYNLSIPIPNDLTYDFVKKIDEYKAKQK